MNAGSETVANGTMAKAIYGAMNGLLGDPGDFAEARKRLAAAIAQGVAT